MQLDPAATWEVLRGGAAASFMLDDRGARMVHGTDEVKSALDIFVKDMGLVTDAARTSSYPAPLASAAEQLYLAGRRAGSAAATTRPSSRCSARDHSVDAGSVSRARHAACG
jgi:3-hydroxyisobutyrate dehydrogenase/putative dehydrogenase